MDKSNYRSFWKTIKNDYEKLVIDEVDEVIRSMRKPKSYYFLSEDELIRILMEIGLSLVAQGLFIGAIELLKKVKSMLSQNRTPYEAVIVTLILSRQKGLSVKELVCKTKFSQNQVRYAIKKLEKTELVTKRGKRARCVNDKTIRESVYIYRKPR